MLFEAVNVLLNTKKQLFSKILVSLPIIFIFLFFAFKILRNLCIFDVDDLNSTYNAYPFLYEENGRYVCNFLSRVFCLYIPNLLGIHIQTAANTIGMVMYMIILTLLVVLSASFYCLKDKKTIIFALCLIFSVLTFARYVLPEPLLYSTMFTFQYGYVLATVFGLAFLLIIYRYVFRHILIKENTTEYSVNKKLFWSILLGFCAGNSSQIISYSIAITIFSLIVITVIYYRFNFEKIKQILFNKKVILPISAFIIGLAMMVLCPGFWKEISWRHAESINQIIDICVPFTKVFFKVVFINQLIFHKIIFTLIILLILKSIFTKQKLKQTILEIIVSVLPILGVCAYYYTLILAGPTFPDSDLKFWLYEPFYCFFLTMVLCSVICLLMGLLLYNVKNKLYIFISILSLANLIATEQFAEYEKYENLVQEMEQVRNDVFICDKTILNSINNNTDIIIYESIGQKYTIYGWSESLNRYIKAAYGINNDKPINYVSDNPNIDYIELETTDFQEFFKYRK